MPQFSHFIHLLHLSYVVQLQTVESHLPRKCPMYDKSTEPFIITDAARETVEVCPVIGNLEVCHFVTDHNDESKQRTSHYNKSSESLLYTLWLLRASVLRRKTAHQFVLSSEVALRGTQNRHLISNGRAHQTPTIC